MSASIPSWLVLTYVGVVSAVIGSFLNVVIARLPSGESLVRPRSRCPVCRHPIRWYDNVPVLSWLVLRGRCRDCGAPISLRYPMVELLMCALGLAVLVRLGPSWQLAMWYPLVAALLAIVFLDVDHYWIPDVITFPAMAWAALGSLLPGGIGPLRAGLGLLPALGLWGFAVVFARVTGREGLGFGDIKLVAVIGLALGPLPALIALFLASIEGSIVGIAVLASGGHPPRAGERRSTDETPSADESLSAKKESPPPHESPPVSTPADSASHPSTSRPTPTPPTPAPPAPDDDEQDWTPPPRAVPFGPFLVLGCYQVLLLPAIFLDWPLHLLGLGRGAP